MDKNPVSKLESNFLFISVFALLMQSLPWIWEMWQRGFVLFSGFGIVVVAYLFLILIWSFGIKNYASRWWWRVWLAILLLAPLWLILLDTSPAKIAQLLALGTLLLIWLIASSRNEGRKIITRFLSIILIAAGITGLLNFWHYFDFVGPCHALSPLRQSRCVRSIPLADNTLVNFGKNVQNDTDSLIYPYGHTVWIEPLERWPAFWDAQVVKFDYWVSTASINHDGTRLYAYQFDSGTQLINMSVQFTKPWISHLTLVEMPNKAFLDEVVFGGWGEDDLQAYAEAWEIHNSQVLQPDDPEWSIVSPSGRWYAVIFHNATISFWQQQLAPPPNRLNTLDPFPKRIAVPDDEPFWSFATNVTPNCLSFSADESLALSHAAYGSDQLDVYNLLEKEHLLSIPFEVHGPCPVFVNNGQLLVAVDDLETDTLYFLDTTTGTEITTIPLPNINVVSLDAAPNEPYLIISVEHQITQENHALLIRTDSLTKD